MKYLLIILFSFSICYGQSISHSNIPLASNIVLVIIVDGQSNAEGIFAPKGQGLYYTSTYMKYTCDSILVNWEGDYLTSDTNTIDFIPMVVNTNTTCVLYSDPANDNYNAGNWGVEQTASRNLQQFLGRKVYVIRNGIGSLDIVRWNSPNGTQWIALKRKINHAISDIEGQGKVPMFVSMAWLQGESDIVLHYAYLYENKLRTLISNIRAISPYTSSMQFCMFKLSAPYNSPPDSMAVINVEA